MQRLSVHIPCEPKLCVSATAGANTPAEPEPNLPWAVVRSANVLGDIRAIVSYSPSSSSEGYHTAHRCLFKSTCRTLCLSAHRAGYSIDGMINRLNYIYCFVRFTFHRIWLVLKGGSRFSCCYLLLQHKGALLL